MLDMKRYFLTIAIGIIGISALMGVAHAQLEGIEYPIAELGNCESEAECRTYCDAPGHLSECLDFAEEHRLMSDKELAQARKFEAVGGEGPGGCTSEAACHAYCEEVTHINECVAFAEENDFLPEEELREVRRIRDALQGGATLPGGCKSKAECEAYCSDAGDTNRFEECIAFAERAGFLENEELAEAKKVLIAIKEKGVTPPPCRGKEQCEVYCNEPSHIEACLAFAEAAGFMDPNEARMARAFIRAGGPQALGCSGENCKEACQSNPEKCAEFFAAHEELLPEEARGQIREGLIEMREAFSQAPPEALACIKEKAGAEFVERVLSGGEVPAAEMMRIGRKMGDEMKACFEAAFKGQGGFGGPEGNIPPEMETCLKEQGINLNEIQGRPPRDFEEKIRACAEKMGGGFGGPGGERPSPEMQACMQNAENEERRRACVEEFDGEDGFGPETQERFRPDTQNGQRQGIPDFVKKCMEQTGFNGQGVPTPEFGKCVSEVRSGNEVSPPQDQNQMPQDGGNWPAPNQPPQDGFTPEQMQQQMMNQQMQEQYQQQYQGSYPPPQEFQSMPPPPTGGFLYRPRNEARLNPPTLLGFFATILGIGQ